MIGLLGPPPPNLLTQGRLTSKFFSDKGEFCAGIPLQDPVPLEKRETTLKEQQDDREKFLCPMRKMLQWEPGKRSSAKELVQDEWIRAHSVRK
ncbi:hypothetical protein LOZ12_006188 [Ophidiomyces ophidiicola]|uniref:Uncharacterized protein n=1 Tax=Ophidiomyces ophidiicola TaxID=1387563 RepID=A0ACB8UQK7_9EURO|nr:uncharacterized protein LOZ57_002245 [Ophidiomyces ophidiicola]KAI1936706.1 hypothetical protein LOZ62_005624 [Ophidiomyces ophidiicola]KAI1949768.1 hypothetical protein LOZ57_002245 [Ophidiomyces ophidiicola]KAI1961569.1 hypothetical protein LOZ59_002371 [Ophidiomyces ophidiicola]KAI1974157.1 hypothetical protein LOZ56_001358 [Ophidiomyces ophidiicola]KAI2021665.1 hypothetical protein LOZ46_002349 [Ophidiomyces ophidiicola]